MKISKPEIIHKNKQIIFSVRVESLDGPETLWYSLDDEYGDFVTNLSDGPLIALFLPAMASGEDIYIDGAISEELWYNLSGPYQKILQIIIPFLRKIKIYPTELKTEEKKASGVATGFSGGIDSYCTLGDYHYSEAPAHLKLTHLLFNNVGSHGEGAERLFLERYEKLKPTAELIGLPFIKVNSNLDLFYKKGLWFQQTHTPRNASVPHVLKGGIGRYFYSSSYSYKDISVSKTTDIAHSDPVILRLLGTETLEAISVGSEYTRIEKTLRVAEIPDSYNTIDVCISSDSAINCSKCWKCMRTLFTLELAGLIEKYSASFNLEEYRRRRNRYIGSILRSRKPLMCELLEFAKDRGYKISLSSRLYALSDPALNKLRRAANKMKLMRP